MAMTIKIREMFGDVNDMLTREQQGVVLHAFEAAVKEVRRYAELCMPEGYETTWLSFGNPFNATIGTEQTDTDRYDPEHFGPYLFRCGVNFYDNSMKGGDNQIEFHVDEVDHKTGDEVIQKRAVQIRLFVKEFLDMKKPEFLLSLTDTDTIEAIVKRAFRTLSESNDEPDEIEKRTIQAAKEYYEVDTDEEARKELIKEWGVFGLRGYAPFVGGLPVDAEYIAKIDDLDIYGSDEEAVEQAIKDGIKMIPYEEQPKNGDYKYFRFVDTARNRKLLGC